MTVFPTDGPARRGGGRPGPASRGNAVPRRPDRSGGAIAYLVVLYDADCPLCRAARRWLASRPQVVPLHFLPAASPETRRLLPGLDHAATLRDITVVADTGEVYVGDAAWLACLWALHSYRELADRLAQPHLLPAARKVIAAAAAVREHTTTGSYGGANEGVDCAGDRCR